MGGKWCQAKWAAQVTGMVSAAPTPDTSGQTMPAVSRPSRGTDRVLCHSQEAGRLSSAFVHSGVGHTTVQEKQVPGDPDVGRR